MEWTKRVPRLPSKRTPRPVSAWMSSRRLHFDHSAFRHLAVARLASLHLLRGIEAEVPMSSALVGKLADAETFGLSVGPTAFNRFASGL